ncbi:MAG: hypothetical protein HKN47_23575 [Pirellulaceae bacterium]|nr:hypothetical protein [Pirellulaceae bacterium]
MVSQVNHVYEYQLDRSDVVISLNDWWLAFAAENSASDLNRESVIGREIWDFIAGKPTQALYREIHRYVRSTGQSVTVPFRCDSPSLQRHMQVQIKLQGDDALLYASTLVRAQRQRKLRLLDAARQTDDSILTMCSCCKRSLLEPTGWLDLEHISLRLRLFEKQTVPQLRYTVCPDCQQQISGDRVKQETAS